LSGLGHKGAVICKQGDNEIKRLLEWPHGTMEKKLLGKCRDIVAGIEPEAEAFLYESRKFLIV